MSLRTRWPLLLCLLLAATGAAPQPPRPWLGRSVQSVLDELRAAGAPLVYSSNLLRNNLTVIREPVATTPLERAREILAPHGLAIREESGMWLVVRGEAPPPVPAAPGAVRLAVQAAYAGTPVAEFRVEVDAPDGPSASSVAGRIEISDLAVGRHLLTVRAAGFLPQRFPIEVVPGQTTVTSLTLVETVPKLEELIVSASRYEVSSKVQPSATYFSREEVESLATLGDDTVRVAQRLPGVASNEFSARPYVRGGAANELAVLLDGVRLVEPYHLRDFQGVFSVIDQRIVDSVAVHAGGFPAAYGDVLSGLMLIEPRQPTELAHELGFSVLYTSLLSSGTFADGRASWLASVRDSNLDRVVADHLGQPAYSDLFLRVAADVGAKHRFVLGSLTFDDDIVLTLDDDASDRERGLSDTNSHQTWFRLDSEWTDALSSSTWLTTSTFNSWRREDVADMDEIVGAVDDRRRFDAVGLKQTWQYRLSDRQSWSAGLDVERRDAEYRYSGVASRTGVLATLRPTTPPVPPIALAPSGESYGVYVEDRVRFTPRLIAELGVRWDRQNYLPPEADSQFSPRASLLYRVGARTDLRLSHGRFFQPEGMLELQVEDGVTGFARAQSAAHSIVSIERRLAGTLALRAEIYRKWTRHVRPRYENLFDPLVLLSELRASRVLIAPERAEARGIELFVSGEQPVSWWAGLSFADVDDLIGGVRVPRSWDQARAANAGVTWPVGGWSLSAVLTVHRGWPITEIAVVTDANGQPLAVAGPRNATRLPRAQRLDFRASKEFATGATHLRFFAEVTNLTDRTNPCCLIYEPVTLPDGSASIAGSRRGRAGVTGNLGLLWRF